MAKNGKDSISLSDIEERKKTLESELADVHAQIQKLDNMRVQLTAQGTPSMVQSNSVICF